MLPTRNDLDEAPEQGTHKVWGQWIGGRFAATNDHIGQ